MPPSPSFRYGAFMKNRILAYVVIALLGIAASVTLSLLNHEPPRAIQGEAAFNIIGRVNNEGSGLFIKNRLVDNAGTLPVRADNGAPFFGEGYTLSVKNGKAWGGLVFGDPGASSIQHTQMATIAAKVGLKFAQYQDGMTKSGDTLYYVTNLSNAGTIATSQALIDGGIIWEPQYQKVLQEQAGTFRQLARTNDLFADHTCCVVAANHNWLAAHGQDAVKFLAGFAQAVRFINEAKAHPDGEDYAWLLAFAQTTTHGLSAEEVRAAIDNIHYVLADDADGSLDQLKKDIALLAAELKGLGLITSKKFGNADDFAAAFVDERYLKEALAAPPAHEGRSTLRIAVINGDIHQLAFRVAKEKGFFEQYGLTIELATGANGGEIATMLLSKDSDLGFLGAPPATLNIINGEHIVDAPQVR